MLRPFLVQKKRPRERTVSADHHQAIDTVQDQIAYGLAPAGHRAENLAARRAENRAAQLQDAANAAPVERLELLATVHHALPTLMDADDFNSLVQSTSSDGPDSCIHARCVATAGNNADPHRRKPPPPLSFDCRLSTTAVHQATRAAGSDHHDPHTLHRRYVGSASA